MGSFGGDYDWQLKFQPAVREIVTVVCREYDVPPTEAEADTLKFLAELQQKGLIVLRT